MNNNYPKIINKVKSKWWNKILPITLMGLGLGIAGAFILYIWFIYQIIIIFLPKI